MAKPHSVTGNTATDQESSGSEKGKTKSGTVLRDRNGVPPKEIYGTKYFIDP